MLNYINEFHCFPSYFALITRFMNCQRKRCMEKVVGILFAHLNFWLEQVEGITYT